LFKFTLENRAAVSATAKTNKRRERRSANFTSSMLFYSYFPQRRLPIEFEDFFIHIINNISIEEFDKKNAVKRQPTFLAVSSADHSTDDK
jgi:hypothetical protein